MFHADGAIPVIRADLNIGNSHCANMGARGFSRLFVRPSGPGALLMGVSLMAASIWSILMLNSG